MALLGTEIRYGSVARLFHWVTAVLVLATWLVAQGERSPTITLHETLGLAVFILVAVRLVWRLFDRRPRHPLPKVVSWSSRAVHALLYFLLIAIPLSAIIGTQLEGHPVMILGLGEFGPYLDASRSVGRSILDVHRRMGTVIVVVAGLHAVAALFHHFILRDAVLKAMLPGRA